MAGPDTLLFDLASALIEAIENYYATHIFDPLYELPTRRYVSDGDPAWDCEQVTCYIVRTYASDGSGEEAPTWAGPLVQRGAEFSIQIVRCSPMVDSEANEPVYPDPAEIESSARVVLNDAEMVWMAISDAYKNGDLPGCHRVQPLSWERAGPDGGYVGGTHGLRILLA